MKISDLIDGSVSRFIYPIDKSIWRSISNSCKGSLSELKHGSNFWSITSTVASYRVRTPICDSMEDLSIKLNENNLLN